MPASARTRSATAIIPSTDDHAPDRKTPQPERLGSAVFVRRCAAARRHADTAALPNVSRRRLRTRPQAGKLLARNRYYNHCWTVLSLWKMLTGNFSRISSMWAILKAAAVRHRSRRRPSPFATHGHRQTKGLNGCRVELDHRATRDRPSRPLACGKRVASGIGTCTKRPCQRPISMFVLPASGGVPGVARHVPAEHAVRGRSRDATNVMARVDVPERDLGAATLKVAHDAIAQHGADVAELRVAARDRWKADRRSCSALARRLRRRR